MLSGVWFLLLSPGDGFCPRLRSRLFPKSPLLLCSQCLFDALVSHSCFGKPYVAYARGFLDDRGLNFEENVTMHQLTIMGYFWEKLVVDVVLVELSIESTRATT